MQNMLSTFWREETGQDIVEYSLMLGFIALTGAAVLTGLRNEMTSAWQVISASFTNAAS